MPPILRDGRTGGRTRTRDYGEITKTCYFRLDPGAKGDKAGEIVGQLGRLAGLGFQVAGL